MTNVHVDEVFGLVGDEGAKVATDNAVPGCALALVELDCF
jgi:hypothetical protein